MKRLLLTLAILPSILVGMNDEQQKVIGLIETLTSNIQDWGSFASQHGAAIDACSSLSTMVSKITTACSEIPAPNGFNPSNGCPLSPEYFDKLSEVAPKGSMISTLATAGGIVMTGLSWAGYAKGAYAGAKGIHNAYDTYKNGPEEEQKKKDAQEWMRANTKIEAILDHEAITQLDVKQLRRLARDEVRSGTQTTFWRDKYNTRLAEEESSSDEEGHQ